VTLRLRQFRNTDLPALCKIWNECFLEPAVAARLTIEGMELYVQSKPFFEQSQIIVAEDDSATTSGEVTGFIHVGPVPDARLEEVDPRLCGIYALCVGRVDNRHDVAKQLLLAADNYCRTRQVTSCQARPSLPSSSFYIGIGPADSLAGVTSSETDLCHWLIAAGFKPAIPTTVWELDVLNFKTLGDRIQMLIRRRSIVNRQIEEPKLPWWQSCALGHTDVTAFHLIDRVANRHLQEVVMWSIGPGLRQHHESIVWLWPPTMDYSPEDVPVEIAPSDRLLFLLAESLRELQNDQVDTVRTVSHAESNDLHRVLNRLGFRAVESGVVFEKTFG
jgi:hypothetical protein